MTALGILVLLSLMSTPACQRAPEASHQESGAQGETEDEVLTGSFSLEFPEQRFQRTLSPVECEVIPSPQGDVIHVAGRASPEESSGDEPVFTARMPGVEVGQQKIYNRRLLPAFFGSAILEDVTVRGTHFDRLEVVAGPVDGSATSYQCTLSTSLEAPWRLRCTDFAPLDWQVPGGRPLAILEAEFDCF